MHLSVETCSLPRLARVIRPYMPEVRGNTAVSLPLRMIVTSSVLDFGGLHLSYYESGFFLLKVLGDVEFLPDPPAQHPFARNVRNGVR
jgi:hypothetical protein